jgi:serine-protein kinase ATM
VRLSPSEEIVNDLLEPASRSLRERSVTQGKIAGTVFFEYATFCTGQLEDQHAIADIKRMEALHKSKQEESLRYIDAIRAAERRKDHNAAKTLSKDRERAQKLQKMDRTELQRLHNLQQTLLKNAIENFLRCFAACSDYDHYVPKFCAIWLKNAKQKGLNTVVALDLKSVPSYKFLPLMHQLCSRLSNEESGFQGTLSELLYRILKDHPFHSIHQIFSSISSVGDSVAVARSSAASRLVQTLSQKQNEGRMSLRDLANILGDQFSAYSDLANLPIDKKTQPNSEIQLSAYPSLRKFRSKALEDVRLPPPTLGIPVSPECNYGSVPYIQKYHHTFKIASGVNQPKILDSVLSNGRSFRELVSLIRDLLIHR